MRKFLASILLAAVASAAAAVTPTPVPTSQVPGYYAPGVISNQPQDLTVHATSYIFDANGLDRNGVRMGNVGMHPVMPSAGLKVPFDAWVQNVVQGNTLAPFTEASPTPTANFGFGVANAGNNCTNGDDMTTDFLFMNTVCAANGMTQVHNGGSYDELSDLGVNWWHNVGREYENNVCPDALNFEFLVENAPLVTGRVKMVVLWYYTGKEQ